MDRRLWARRVATWFGCGRSPIAPGTVGSIGAVPLHLLLRRLPPALHVGAILGVVAVGLWAADEYASELDEDDPSSAVIDEVAGTLIALGLVRNGGVITQALALLLFRVLDIVKPGPIDSAQSLKPRGLGIMADDLLAGALAGVLARLIG